MISANGISSITREVNKHKYIFSGDSNQVLNNDNAENCKISKNIIVRESECIPHLSKESGRSLNSISNVRHDVQAPCKLQNRNDTSRSPNNRSPQLTPKHLVPCPFLRRRGYCLKGSKCDFLFLLLIIIIKIHLLSAN